MKKLFCLLAAFLLALSCAAAEESGEQSDRFAAAEDQRAVFAGTPEEQRQRLFSVDAPGTCRTHLDQPPVIRLFRRL